MHCKNIELALKFLGKTLSISISPKLETVLQLIELVACIVQKTFYPSFCLWNRLYLETMRNHSEVSYSKNKYLGNNQLFWKQGTYHQFYHNSYN